MFFIIHTSLPSKQFGGVTVKTCQDLSGPVRTCQEIHVAVLRHSVTCLSPQEMQSVLRIAVENGQHEAVETLLSAGATVEENWSKVHGAAASGGNPTMQPGCKIRCFGIRSWEVLGVLDMFSS